MPNARMEQPAAAHGTARCGADSWIGFLEFARSPDGKKVARGVHGRPNLRVRSLLFLVDLSVGD